MGGRVSGVFSIFDLDAPSSDLINTDLFCRPAGTYRINDLSAFLRIFHQSSHLGDEFILRNRIDRVNLSFEGVDLKSSYRLFDWLRLYGGGGYLFNLDPSGFEPWATQGGIELQTPLEILGRLNALRHGCGSPNTDKKTDGARISPCAAVFSLKGREVLCGRFLSCSNTTYRGHSPNGQFFDRKIEYFGPGLYLDF